MIVSDVLMIYSGAVLFDVHPVLTIAIGFVPLMPYPYVPSALIPDIIGVIVNALPMILAGESITGDVALAWRTLASIPNFTHLLIFMSEFNRKDVRENLLLSIKPSCEY